MKTYRSTFLPRNNASHGASREMRRNMIKSSADAFSAVVWGNNQSVLSVREGSEIFLPPRHLTYCLTSEIAEQRETVLGFFFSAHISASSARNQERKGTCRRFEGPGSGHLVQQLFQLALHTNKPVGNSILRDLDVKMDEAPL